MTNKISLTTHGEHDAYVLSKITSPFCYFRYREGAGTTIIDSGGNVADQTIVGTLGAFWTTNAASGEVVFNTNGNYIDSTDAYLADLLTPTGGGQIIILHDIYYDSAGTGEALIWNIGSIDSSAVGNLSMTAITGNAGICASQAVDGGQELEPNANLYNADTWNYIAHDIRLDNTADIDWYLWNNAVENPANFPINKGAFSTEASRTFVAPRVQLYTRRLGAGQTPIDTNVNCDSASPITKAGRFFVMKRPTVDTSLGEKLAQQWTSNANLPIALIGA